MEWGDVVPNSVESSVLGISGGQRLSRPTGSQRPDILTTC